jgi:hypothetical protein
MGVEIQIKLFCMQGPLAIGTQGYPEMNFSLPPKEKIRKSLWGKT